MPTAEADDRTDEPDTDPGDAAAEHDDREVARADVDVAEHPVALAVVEDRLGQAGDAAERRTTRGRCR